MDMPVQSNPRKLYQSGNGVVVSIPGDIREKADLQKGDRVILTADEDGIRMEEVEYRRASDE